MDATLPCCVIMVVAGVWCARGKRKKLALAVILTAALPPLIGMFGTMAIAAGR